MAVLTCIEKYDDGDLELCLGLELSTYCLSPSLFKVLIHQYFSFFPPLSDILKLVGVCKNVVSVPSQV